MAMTEEHKEALAQGRREARAIKAYLEALESRKPGRPVTREGLEDRLQAVNTKLGASENPLESVELIQTRLDLEDAISNLGQQENFEELESAFVANAKTYSERKGISYSAWREFGVPAATVRAAGIPETRRR